MDNKEKTKLIALGKQGTTYEFTIKNNYEFSLKQQELRINLIEEADGNPRCPEKYWRYW